MADGYDQLGEPPPGLYPAATCVGPWPDRSAAESSNCRREPQGLCAELASWRIRCRPHPTSWPRWQILRERS